MPPLGKMTHAALIKQLLRRTGVMFLLFLAATIIPTVINFPPPWDARFDRIFKIVAVLTLFFQGVAWTNTLVAYWRTLYIQRHQDEYGATTTIGAVAAMVRVVLAALLALMALDALGFRVTTLLAGLGIGGIAIAFALQSILADLFGALSIVFDRPFDVGDAIQVDNFSGRVERIGLKSTRIRSDDGEQIVFANGELLKGRLRNYQRLRERRVRLITRVRGSTPPDVLETIPDLLRQIITAQPNTRFARSHLSAIGDATIDFETVYYVTDPGYAVFMDTQHAIYLAILRTFGERQIELSAQLEAAVKEKTAGRNPGGVPTPPV